MKTTLPAILFLLDAAVLCVLLAAVARSRHSGVEEIASKLDDLEDRLTKKLLEIVARQQGRIL